MNNCFIITSSIEVDSSRIFKFQNPRSCFTDAERLQQTLNTVMNINVVEPNSTIFLIDSSKKRFSEFDNFPNVEYVQLESLNPQIAEQVRTHHSIAYCEAAMLLEFFKYIDLTNYDFVTKIHGRYSTNRDFNTLQFTEENKHKFFFKQPIVYSYPNLHESFRSIIPHEMVISNHLCGFYSHLFALGSAKFDLFRLYLELITIKTSSQYSSFWWMDIEYFLYYYTHMFGFLPDVEIINWPVIGWNGSYGNFITF